MAEIPEQYTWLQNIEELIPEIPEESIISRPVYQDHHLKVILFGFAAGQALSEHKAAQPATLHILRGNADLTLGADAFSAQAGSWVYMAPGLPHSVHATSELVMVLMLMKE